jgi:hypothetical protein
MGSDPAAAAPAHIGESIGAPIAGPGLPNTVSPENAIAKRAQPSDCVDGPSLQQIERLESDVRNPMTGFVVRDRKHKIRTYDACFVGARFSRFEFGNLIDRLRWSGREAVDWLVQHLELSRPQAVQLGQHLFVRHLSIAPVTELTGWRCSGAVSSNP